MMKLEIGEKYWLKEKKEPSCPVVYVGRRKGRFVFAYYINSLRRTSAKGEEIIKVSRLERIGNRKMLASGAKWITLEEHSKEVFPDKNSRQIYCDSILELARAGVAKRNSSNPFFVLCSVYGLK